MGKLLDIRGRLGKDSSSYQEAGASGGKELAPSGELLDMTARREAALTEDRRKVRRTILTEFIAVHTVVPGFGLMRVSLYNINDKGLAFELDAARGSFHPGEEVAMRVYLNHQTYFPFIVKIKHITEVVDEGVVRHGCEFVNGTINDVALQHFVGFIESVSASLHSDKGDILVSGINS
jgi:hypothetical protein